jgi:hypothetical protein
MGITIISVLSGCITMGIVNRITNCLSNITKIAMGFTLIAMTQSSVLAESQSEEIAQNEAILSGYSTCKVANKAGYKNLRTRVGFKPTQAKRSFDADNDGISCETR